MQHMDALNYANEVRTFRAGLKRQILSGEKTVDEVLFDVPVFAAGMTAFDLLQAQHRWGRTRTRRALASARVPEGKKLGELTQRQALAISERVL